MTVEEIGGGVADHLKIGHAHFNDYLSIGATPATTGGVRLAQHDGPFWRNYSDTGNLQVVAIHSPYDEENALLFAGTGTQNSLIISPDFTDVTTWKGLVISTLNIGAGTSTNTEIASIDSAGNGVDGNVSIAIGVGQHVALNLGNAAGVATTQLIANGANAADVIALRAVLGTILCQAVHFQFGTLPTTDPGAGNGEAWVVDGAGLAAALAAGSKYLLVHP